MRVSIVRPKPIDRYIPKCLCCRWRTRRRILGGHGTTYLDEYCQECVNRFSEAVRDIERIRQHKQEVAIAHD